MTSQQKFLVGVAAGAAAVSYALPAASCLLLSIHCLLPAACCRSTAAACCQPPASYDGLITTLMH